MTYERALDALGDGTRRRIVELIRLQPRSVNELVAALPISQPATSQHLKVLETAGLVRHESVGARHIYEIAPEGFAELETYLQAFWAQALAGLKDVAESDERAR